MFVDGVVKTYNAERGFGFISVDGHKKDIFFHITDFPNRNISPNIGERLKFRIVEDAGKSKAENIVRLDVKFESQSQMRNQTHSQSHNKRKTSENNHGSGSSFIFSILGLIVIVGLIYMIYGKYQRAQLAMQAPVSVQQVLDTPVNSNPHNYSCDGRTRCSQMSSREEARWFIRNCPGTQMDGNNDGEPCESDSRW